MSACLSVCPSVRVCLSVCLHVSARLPLHGFPRNLTLGAFTELCREIPNLVEIGQKVGHSTWIPKCVPYCWQRRMQRNNREKALLCFSGSAFSIYYSADIHVCVCVCVCVCVYVNNTKGTHCCSSMTKIVTQTRHSVSYMYITDLLPR
jgi:hypothetical protein